MEAWIEHMRFLLHLFGREIKKPTRVRFCDMGSDEDDACDDRIVCQVVDHLV